MVHLGALRAGAVLVFVLTWISAPLGTAAVMILIAIIAREASA